MIYILCNRYLQDIHIFIYPWLNPNFVSQKYINSLPAALIQYLIEALLFGRHSIGHNKAREP